MRLILVSLAFLLPAAAAAAPIDDAKVSFNAGKDAFERGDYEAALAHFQRANSLVPAPSLQYNIGTTFERLGRWRDAAGAFEKYLELAGAPTTDEERDFQEKLRARATANRRRAESQSPPPPPGVPPPQPPAAMPPPNYYPPSPYYQGGYGYAPVAPPPIPKEVRLKDAQGRRSRAIALIAVGTVLTVVGIAVLTDAFLNDHCRVGSFQANSPGDCPANWGEGFLGFTFGVVGITLWAPGAASFVKSQREITELSHPEPPKGAQLPATMFKSPVFRF